MQSEAFRHPAKTREDGFTLVELSIVLTIIGLLIGGVIAGRSLIRSAEIRSVATSFSELQIAVKEFQMQYKGIPGDMTDATRYWDALDANAATCRTLPSDGSKKTCNGDGNGKIFVGTNESFRFWQQLSNAGLLPGKYTGIRGTGSAQHAVPNENIPSFRGLPGIGWSFDESCSSGSIWYWDRVDEGNSWVLGAAGTMYSTEGGAFSLAEAWGIDKKIDDGKPGTGVVQTQPHLTTGDRTQSSTAEYDVGDEKRKAAIWFVKVF